MRFKNFFQITVNISHIIKHLIKNFKDILMQIFQKNIILNRK
jgi:hypothetical protein